MNERLSQFLAAENISQSQFADSIGVARASISHIIAGRNKPGYDFIVSMMQRYPNLNIEWLLAGRGKMYRSSSDVPGTGTVLPPAETPAATEKPTTTAEPEDNVPNIFNSRPYESPEPENAQTAPELNIPSQSAISTEIPQSRSIDKIVIFYSDNTFQEIKA